MMMMMMMMMMVAFGATSVNSKSFLCHCARFYKANDSKELPHLGVGLSKFVGNIRSEGVEPQQIEGLETELFLIFVHFLESFSTGFCVNKRLICSPRRCFS